MIKIVRLITRLNIGGPSIHAITLSAELPGEGFHTTLVCGQPGPHEGDMTQLASGRGCNPVVISSLKRSIRPVDDLVSLFRIIGLIRRERPDIIHTHMSKAGALGRVAALFCGNVKTVHTFHGHVLSDYFSKFRTRLYLLLERWLARRTERLVALSESQREELLRRYRIGRSTQYTVIPLGLDLERFSAVDSLRGYLRKELAIPSEAPVIAIVGRLVPIKDHFLFLDVARRVLDERGDSVFLIVGDGPLRAELEARTREMGFGNNCRFLGWRRDLERVYADADVVVLTSRNEGTPVSLIEAAASGKPVVATNVGGVKDVVKDGSSGLLAGSRDPRKIAGLILGLIGDMSRAKEMGRAGRKFVCDRFDKKRLLGDMARLYTKIMER